MRTSTVATILPIAVLQGSAGTSPARIITPKRRSLVTGRARGRRALHQVEGVAVIPSRSPVAGNAGPADQAAMSITKLRQRRARRARTLAHLPLRRFRHRHPDRKVIPTPFGTGDRHDRLPTAVKRARTFRTCAATVPGSAVLPVKTSTATGQPSRAQSSPKTICCLPFLPSRLWPKAASGQCFPSTKSWTSCRRASGCRPAGDGGPGSARSSAGGRAASRAWPASRCRSPRRGRARRRGWKRRSRARAAGSWPAWNPAPAPGPRWPCVRRRRTRKASSGRSNAIPPLITRRMPSTIPGGRCVRLARIFLRMRLPSRSRIVGRWPRFGMASMW